ncbi:AAA domain-containing protein [Microscilla marina]|uniref:Uncharacterized protein n=1 Tax=Microscilla marina ATCC 23134 TaxID=313606 RepID=A1ZRT1_MICM2|nr:AAA domain-containing protein [Microscilla marina]EAY26986.1 conserved hypothetical protein [Microscilla marina ATCC 23134]
MHTNQLSNFQNLLSCWHKLEHFSPSNIPRGKNTSKFEGIEPWKANLRASNSKKEIEYTIYLGVFELSHANKFVEDFFGTKSDNPNQNKGGNICYASLKINEAGHYVEESLGIPTFPWALNQLGKNEINNDNWALRFEALNDELKKELESLVNAIHQDEERRLIKIPKVLSCNLLLSFQKLVIDTIGWEFGSNIKKDIYIKAEEKYKKTKKSLDENSSNADLLNSFYINDLETISRALKSDVEMPFAFQNYIRGSLNEQQKRFDLAKDIQVLKDDLQPLKYPDGCWPSDYSLSLMQQLAVTHTFNSLSDGNQSGIYSVNGPPGTGKTTLLRDVIAAIIVKRAKVLSGITNPANAFEYVGQVYINDNYSLYIYSPDSSLTQGGMVVASSNNGAVENISKELPLKSEVGSFVDEIGYFREVAQHCIDPSNWGLISVVLGNKQKRSTLVNKLWFNKKEGGKDFRETLKENKPETNTSWREAIKAFNLKLQEVATEKEHLEQCRTDYIALTTAKAQEKIQQVELVKVKEVKVQLEEEIKLYVSKEQELKKTRTELHSDLAMIKKHKPGFFSYWFNKERRNTYKQRIQATENSLLEKENRLRDTAQKLDDLKQKHQEQSAKVNQIQQSINQQINTINRLSPKIKSDKDKLGNNYADDDFWQNIETKTSQEACPWYSPKLKKLQSELFIAALKLNESFILHANTQSSRISTTLAGFFEYLRGNNTYSRKMIKAMWDTFFLVIPVVSTTFASVHRMFQGLDKEDLPWLFIDEAGQAVPQAAAGAIWRSKRVMVVGDPFQIEPVVTIPDVITNNLREYFGLHEQQISTELSVQSMADRMNYLGTYREIQGPPTWIGMPLRVHRRCIEPMFSIANNIAYEGTMVLSTATPKQVNLQMESNFIHCTGKVQGRHFVQEQANLVKELLLRETSFCGDLPNVFVITPFTEIGYKLKGDLFNPLIQWLNRVNSSSENGDKLSEWLDSHIGTVHTFQGKQADAVILCLGLDDRIKGAATWASQKPNLLNVALTRAKYRFVAIGDKDIWLKQPYFMQLSKLNEVDVIA